MITVDELIKEVSSLKMSSEQLSTMFGAAGTEMQRNTNKIAALVRGSNSGQEAVASLGVASRSLVEAAASIKSLSRICDECVVSLSK